MLTGSWGRPPLTSVGRTLYRSVNSLNCQVEMKGRGMYNNPLHYPPELQWIIIILLSLGGISCGLNFCGVKRMCWLHNIMYSGSRSIEALGLGLRGKKYYELFQRCFDCPVICSLNICSPYCKYSEVKSLTKMTCPIAGSDGSIKC